MCTLESQARRFCPVEIKASGGPAKALDRLAGKFLLGGAAGVTAAGLVIACAACAVAVGAILGNCLLTCLEML